MENVIEAQKASAVVGKIRFADFDLLPPSFRALPQKDKGGNGASATTKVLVPQAGTEILKSTPGVSAENLLFDMSNGGYGVTSVTLERHVEPGKYAKKYFIVRIDLAPGVEPSNKWAKLLTDLYVEVLGVNLWHCQVYRNTFYKDGAAVDGAHALSFNFSGRTPLMQGGKPVMVRQGETKVALKPAFKIRYNADKGAHFE